MLYQDCTISKMPRLMKTRFLPMFCADHPYGKHKAKMFASLGFQIRDGGDTDEPFEASGSRSLNEIKSSLRAGHFYNPIQDYGLKISAKTTIKTPKGHNAVLQSGWHFDYKSNGNKKEQLADKARLVSVYPRELRRHAGTCQKPE